MCKTESRRVCFSWVKDLEMLLATPNSKAPLKHSLRTRAARKPNDENGVFVYIDIIQRSW